MPRVGLGAVGLQAPSRPDRAWARRARGLATSRLVSRLLVLLLFIWAWGLAVASVGGLLTPTFGEAVGGALDLIREGVAWEALLASNKALVLGYGLAVIIGVPLGLIIGQSEVAERAASPYLSILLVTPMAALIPSFIIAFGVGLSSRALLVMLFAVVMVVVNSRAGVRQVPPRLIEMARSYGASRIQVWRRVLLPGALPAIMTGLRIGLGRAISGVVIIELLMAPAGIGEVILNARDSFAPGILYGMVILVLLESSILIEMLRLTEKRLVRWRA